MTYNVAGPYGSTDGTQEGPETSIGNITPVTFIDGYADSSYVYGIRLHWGTTTSRLYGQTNSLDPQPLDCDNDPVYLVKVFVNSNTGLLEGVKFKTISNATIELGYLDGSAKQTAFEDIDNVLTNMVTYRSLTRIEGIKFRYTGPAAARRANYIAAALAYPALATLAYTIVGAKSCMEVGKFQRELSIKSPSYDPSLKTSPSDAQLCCPTFCAQENCKEMLSVYLPSILISSTLGYYAFGRWTPRVVGTLTFAAALFRYKSFTAYIENPDKRGKPFDYAQMCMRPVVFLAVASAVYLLGEELYVTFKDWWGSCKEEEDDYQKRKNKKK